MARQLHKSIVNNALDHQKSQGFTDVGLLKISENVKAYAYLILSSQASARSGITGNILPKKLF